MGPGQTRAQTLVPACIGYGLHLSGSQFISQWGGENEQSLELGGVE